MSLGVLLLRKSHRENQESSTLDLRSRSSPAPVNRTSTSRKADNTKRKTESRIQSAGEKSKKKLKKHKGRKFNQGRLARLVAFSEGESLGTVGKNDEESSYKANKVESESDMRNSNLNQRPKSPQI